MSSSRVHAASLLLCLLICSVSLAVTAEDSEPVWIDVRSWIEHQIDPIEGDAHIPYRNIVDTVTERFPDKATPIRLYCTRGVRAEKALYRLRDAGYLDVENSGGIQQVRSLRFSQQVR